MKVSLPIGKLVFTSALFFTLLASAKTYTNTGSNFFITFTHEIRLAETSSKSDEPRSEAIRKYLADIFGVPDLKAAWYDNIFDVKVSGDSVTIKTNLSSGDEKLINLCGVVSGFIYSHLNVQLTIRKVKIIGSSGEILVFRRSVLDDCPYKFSPNPPLQPPARQLR
jgi:hypothetical protein